MKINLKYPMFLAILAGILFFFKLGSYSLYNAAETTYGEFVKNILTSGDWLTLHFNGQIIFDKPPLYYWLVAVISKFFGFSEFTMRAPAALAGILTVLATFYLGKKFYNSRAGFFSAIIAMTAFQFLIQSRIAELDIVLTFLMTLSVLWFYCGFLSGEKKYYLLSYVPLGFAMLIKGLLGIALPAAAIVFFLFFKKELFRLKGMSPVLGAIIIAAIGLPWYIAEYLIHGKIFLEFAFGFLFLSRFSSAVSGHTGPWHYYFPALLLGFAPWSQFLPFSLIRMWKERKNNPALLSLCFIIPAFLVFSIAKTKIPNYILPLYPFLAISIGKIWDDFLSADGKTLFKGMFFSNILLIIVVFLVMAAAGIAGRNYSGPYQEMLPQIYTLGALLGIGSVVSISLFIFKKELWSFYAVPIMVFIIAGYLNLYTLPAVEKYKGEKYLGLSVAKAIKPKEIIAAYDTGNRPGIVFYNSRLVVFLETEKEVVNFLRDKKGYCFVLGDKTNKFTGFGRIFLKKGDLAVLH